MCSPSLSLVTSSSWALNDSRELGGTIRIVHPLSDHCYGNDSRIGLSELISDIIHLFYQISSKNSTNWTTHFLVTIQAPPTTTLATYNGSHDMKPYLAMFSCSFSVIISSIPPTSSATCVMMCVWCMCVMMCVWYMCVWYMCVMMCV